MSARLTKRQGSPVGLTRGHKRPSVLDKIDVARELGARVVQEGAGAPTGNPLSRLASRRGIAAWLAPVDEADLDTQDAQAFLELLERVRGRVADVDARRLLLALVHRALSQVSREPSGIEEEIADYIESLPPVAKTGTR